MKSKEQTDIEILESAKEADVIIPETSSIITRRHTSSVHSIQCNCSIHANLKLRANDSEQAEDLEKAKRDWWNGK